MQLETDAMYRYNLHMTPKARKTSTEAPSDRSRLIWYFVFLVYLAVLLYLIFDYTERGQPAEHGSFLNLVFFQEIKRFWNAIRGGYITVTAWLNLAGNIILFIPFGILVPLITNRRLTGLKTALAAIVAVGAIETYQLVSKTGVFDVDDFLLNWFGVLLGWLIYKAVSAVSNRMLNKEH